MFIFYFRMLIPIVRVVVIIEYTIAFSMFYRLLSFNSAKNFRPVFCSQDDRDKFKTFVDVRVNIFIFYGSAISLVSPNAAHDDHNKIIELITGYFH